jgi:transketolase
MDTKELQLLAEQRRKRLVEVVYRAKAGHIGGDLSCLNVMTALYFHVMQGLDPANPKAPDRDRFVLSKGHCVEALYVTLEAKGFLKPEVLDTLGQFGSILSGHPTIEVPGIEVNSGALGHGLSIGVGMALAAKMREGSYKSHETYETYKTHKTHKSYNTYVLMGDGEQGEGSIYEAAMAAHKYQLDNLVAIIDRNHLQISGNTEDVMPLDSIRERWTAFGWDVTTMNGDAMDDIVSTFDAIDYTNGKPHLLISEATKGFGVSFMEGVAKWHHGVLNEEQCQAAVKEIEERINELTIQRHNEIPL